MYPLPSISPSISARWTSPGDYSNPSARFDDDGPFVWEPQKQERMTTTRDAPAFRPRSEGFLMRTMRSLSRLLPGFQPQFHNAEKEKLERDQRTWNRIPLLERLRLLSARMGRKMRIRLLIVFAILFCVYVSYHSPLIYHWRRTSWLGGGEKFVIILSANIGGGVNDWKGAREWAIERDSIRNKKKYVARWGYELEIVDMTSKKRYAHEWRESWEKVDFIRSSLKKYPNAEWFWWLDLNTFIMEPTYSLQNHLFNQLDKHVYRDINTYNPLNITHPPNEVYLDDDYKSPDGDGDTRSINMVFAQDCSGFNLGSFFIRRSTWTERLLDVWWDPVLYEQKHTEWEHKEQDALEQLYTDQAWVRKHTAFVPQRMINSFPVGACAEKGPNKLFHYDQKDRDFLVNMAGCEWGRDCWGEMYNFRELSYYLNRTWWERFKEDFLALIWFKLTGQKVKF